MSHSQPAVVTERIVEYIDSILAGNPTIGTTTSTTTINGNIIANNLAVNNNTTIGENSENSLTVNSTANFVSTVTTPHCIVPTINGNSFKLGSCNVILYVECVANVNIYVSYPLSVVLVVKNISEGVIVVTYNSTNTTTIIEPNSAITFLKISATAFIPITNPPV